MLLSGIVLALGGVAILVVAGMGWAGVLPRNRWNGIRTRATMVNDDTWYGAHKAGGPGLTAAGVAWIAAGAAMARDQAWWVGLFIGGACLAIVGAVRGQRAAQRVTRGR